MSTFHVQCILFVVSSKDNSADKNYALLPQRFTNHQACEIFLKNDIQVITNSQVNVRRNVTYKFIEIFLNEIKADARPSLIRLYANANDSEFVRQLLSERGSNSRFQFFTKFPETTLQLHLATTEENLQVIKHFATSKANIQYCHPFGGSLMHFAAKIGDVALISALQEWKKSLNTKGKNSATPLHVAAESKCLKSCKFLVQKGAKIDAKMSDRSTPLHLATKRGALEVVQFLMENGADSEAKRYDGLTPLLIAVKKGYLKVVQYLLQRVNINYTVDANDSPMKGAHPLHFAVKENRVEITKLLLQNGANVDSECANGTSVLFFAATTGSTCIMAHLLSKGPSINSPGNRAAFQQAFKKPMADASSKELSRAYKILIERMLAYGFDVVPEDVNEPDVFFGAICMNLFEVVQKLLNFGVDVNQFHSHRNIQLSPLHLAIMHEHKNIIELLLDHKANPNAKRGPPTHGRTPLVDAIQTGNLTAIKLLLANNASIRVDPSPLLYALGKDNSTDAASHYIKSMYQQRKRENKNRIVELLLENGATMNAQCFKSATPLYIVMEEDHLETAEVLMKFASCFSFNDVLKIVSAKFVTESKTLSAVLDYGFADLNSTDKLCLKKFFDSYVATTRRVSAELLALYVAKTAAAFKFNARELVSSPHYEAFRLHNFTKKCETEILYLKSVEIGRTNISFYDVLTKDVKQVACCARNENFSETLEYHDTKRRFQIYGSILDRRIRLGILRRNLLKTAIKMFKFLFSQFSTLPYDIMEEIVDLLSNQDIIILQNCLKGGRV